MDNNGALFHLIVLAVINLITDGAIVAAQVWLWRNIPTYIDQGYVVYHPGPRSGSSAWGDVKGSLWLFGGHTFWDLQTDKDPVLLNDLWLHCTEENSWVLLHSGWQDKKKPPPPYLTVPKPRYDSMACGIPEIMFVLYGGAEESGYALNDTWAFYQKRKRWINLSKVKKNFRSPPSRWAAAVWCLEDSMIIFGGRDQSALLSDMWSFSLRDLTWTKIHASPWNDTGLPRGRSDATTWVGKDDKLYMFGGNILNPFTHRKLKSAGYTSDLWVFSLENSTWACISGCAHHRSLSSSKRLSNCLASEDIPQCRGKSAGWTDSKENLWLFGGIGNKDGGLLEMKLSKEPFSDLWLFNTQNFTWKMMASNNRTTEDDKHYHDPLNQYKQPLARYNSIQWSLKDNFFIFGGIGFPINHQNESSYLDDQWVLNISYNIHNHLTLTPSVIFLFCLASISAILLLFCASVSVQRCRHFPRLNHPDGRDYKVKYSPLTETTSFDS